MDSPAPAPGSTVIGAPPALRRPLTPADGAQPPERARGRDQGHDPSPAHRPDSTREGHEPTHGMDRTPPLSSYLPAFGLLCAAAAVWLGTRRRRSTTTN